LKSDVSRTHWLSQYLIQLELETDLPGTEDRSQRTEDNHADRLLSQSQNSTPSPAGAVEALIPGSHGHDIQVQVQVTSHVTVLVRRRPPAWRLPSQVPSLTQALRVGNLLFGGHGTCPGSGRRPLQGAP
jgi:hypothetical protein